MAQCGKKDGEGILMVFANNEVMSAPLYIGVALGQVTEALVEKGVAEAPRWAATLLAAVLDVPTSDLMPHRGDPLTTAQVERLRDLMGQVTPDAPVAYLVGRAPFLGRDFEITPDTLIPKRDTELFLEILFDRLAAPPTAAEPARPGTVLRQRLRRRHSGRAPAGVSRRRHGHFPRRPGRRPAQRRALRLGRPGRAWGGRSLRAGGITVGGPSL